MPHVYKQWLEKQKFIYLWHIRSIMTSEMDNKDEKILEVLKEHGDYTVRQIAKKTLLPATTIHNRIRKLKKEGVITKFTVELDPARTNRGFAAYILISANLQLLKEKKKSQYDLMKQLKMLPFVEKIDIVTGGTDLVVFLRVKDVQEFDKVLLNKIQLIEGIDKTQSLIVIHGSS